MQCTRAAILTAILATMLSCTSAANAKPTQPSAAKSTATNPTPLKTDGDRIRKNLERFTAVPHPFGSAAQLIYAKELVAAFETAGLDARLQSFRSSVPCLMPHDRPNCKDRMLELDGYNVIATTRGWAECSLVLSGHYDTKHFPNFRFVGANDGGSSTALLLEQARVVNEFRNNLKPKERKAHQGQWIACDLHFVLFDGEEARLEDWFDGITTLGVQDNTYGSRKFVSEHLGKDDKLSLEKSKPVSLAFIIDMIGHKNQSLMISKGSQPDATKWLVANRRNVVIDALERPVEDDHKPFMDAKIPFVHIIDLDNMDEWHTPKDTMDIISIEKILGFADLMNRFLFADRKESGADR